MIKNEDEKEGNDAAEIGRRTRTTQLLKPAHDIYHVTYAHTNPQSNLKHLNFTNKEEEEEESSV